MILDWIDFASLGIEILAVTIIAVSIALSTVPFLYQSVLRLTTEDRFWRYKYGLCRALLLGLEILVAAGIVRTVAWEAMLQSVHGSWPASADPDLSALVAGRRGRGSLALAARAR